MQGRHTTHLLLRLSFLLVVFLILTACGRQRSILLIDPVEPQSTPTVSAAFVPYMPTLEPAPTVPLATLSPRGQQSSDPLADVPMTLVTVYEDTLAPGWSLDHSSYMNYDLESNIFVDKGRYSIHAQPRLKEGTLYFTLNQDAGKTYARDQVLGVRFRLSGGAAAIPNDALAVAVIGSNARSYWIENDTSVKIEGRVTDNQPLFSETRLYYLNINQTIPAKSWVDVIVWLDDLMYDPIYKYVTGFYLKADREMLPSFYVDQVSLMVMK